MGAYPMDPNVRLEVQCCLPNQAPNPPPQLLGQLCCEHKQAGASNESSNHLFMIPVSMFRCVGCLCFFGDTHSDALFGSIWCALPGCDLLSELFIHRSGVICAGKFPHRAPVRAAQAA